MGKGKDFGEVCAVCGAATFCCLCVLIALTLMGLGIAKIVIGAIHLHDCDLERLVPIYLIVAGCAPVLLSGLGQRASDDENQSSGKLVCGIIGFLFNLAWTICGTVWVYPTYAIVKSADYTPCGVNMTQGCTEGTCESSLITFAFAMVTIDWVLCGGYIIVVGCMLFVLCKKCLPI